MDFWKLSQVTLLCAVHKAALRSQWNEKETNKYILSDNKRVFWPCMHVDLLLGIPKPKYEPCITHNMSSLIKQQKTDLDWFTSVALLNINLYLNYAMLYFTFESFLYYFVPEY